MSPLDEKLGALYTIFRKKCGTTRFVSPDDPDSPYTDSWSMTTEYTEPCLQVLYMLNAVNESNKDYDKWHKKLPGDFFLGVQYYRNCFTVHRIERMLNKIEITYKW